ncbi:MAG: S1 RNA-binding domain-containing protein [Candidatus Lokiarchaeota archaeon]|nr:S1 RNA-binding domain-containing protein [Candidatus Lokiarchaeota archaeon]
MVKSRVKFPKEGEFVVAKVTEVQNQYVYVDLIDFEGLPSDEAARGMIHISEISSRWIKNIRNFVRIGQRVVLRVLRVDPSKGHVDMSLRRVNSAQKEIRLKEWKYAVKYENLLQFLTETEGINMSLDEVYDKIGFPILDFFENYQEAIENLKENGEEILDHLEDISDDTKKALLKIVDENVQISTVTISGKVVLSFNTENGVEEIKESLLGALKVIDSKETRKISISYIAAPFYRLEVITKDYLDAENILSDALEVIEQKTNQYNGSYEFIRD